MDVRDVKVASFVLFCLLVWRANGCLRFTCCSIFPFLFPQWLRCFILPASKIVFFILPASKIGYFILPVSRIIGACIATTACCCCGTCIIDQGGGLIRKQHQQQNQQRRSREMIWPPLFFFNPLRVILIGELFFPQIFDIFFAQFFNLPYFPVFFPNIGMLTNLIFLVSGEFYE